MPFRPRHAAAPTLMLCAACGSPTSPSQPPPVKEITLTCPADIRLGSIGTPTVLVTYPAPTAAGGTPPVTITCSPPSNTAFPLGTTTVNCSGTDGVRTAACSFKVTLVPPQPVLSVQNFIAFGDSITAGENGLSSLFVIDLGNSYPAQLRALMQARYTTQSPQVHNCGVPGETAQAGALRVENSVLDFYKADVLLLLEGVDSLTGSFAQDAQVIQTALTRDILATRTRNMAGVFLSTLLPVFPGNCTPTGPTCRGNEIDNGEIVNVNGVIYSLAAQQNVPLVDNYTAFAGHPEYIGQDGLHPLPLGNQVLAKQFLAAIQSKFEGLQPTSVQHVSGAAPFATSPQCPYDGQTAVTVSRSPRR